MHLNTCPTPSARGSAWKLPVNTGCMIMQSFQSCMLPLLHQTCQQGSVVFSENHVVSASWSKDAACSLKNYLFKISAVYISIPSTAHSTQRALPGKFCAWAPALPGSIWSAHMVWELHKAAPERQGSAHFAAVAEITQPGLCCGCCDETSWWVRSATAVNTRLPRVHNGNLLVEYPVSGWLVWRNKTQAPSSLRKEGSEGGKSSS